MFQNGHILYINLFSFNCHYVKLYSITELSLNTANFGLKLYFKVSVIFNRFTLNLHRNRMDDL